MITKKFLIDNIDNCEIADGIIEKIDVLYFNDEIMLNFIVKVEHGGCSILNGFKIEKNLGKIIKSLYLLLSNDIPKNETIDVFEKLKGMNVRIVFKNYVGIAIGNATDDKFMLTEELINL